MQEKIPRTKTQTIKQLGSVEKRGVVFKEADLLVKINPFDEEDLKLVNKGTSINESIVSQIKSRIDEAIAAKEQRLFLWMPCQEFLEHKIWMF